MSDPIRQQGEYEEFPKSHTSAGRSAGMIWALRAAGPIAALLVWLALGNSSDLSNDARFVAAIGTLMAIWWIS